LHYGFHAVFPTLRYGHHEREYNQGKFVYFGLAGGPI